MDWNKLDQAFGAIHNASTWAHTIIESGGSFKHHRDSDLIEVMVRRLKQIDDVVETTRLTIDHRIKGG